jgi:flagellar FliL protein
MAKAPSKPAVKAAEPEKAEEADATPAPAGGSIMSLIVALLVVTGLGVGVGGLFGLLVMPRMEKPVAQGKGEAAGAPVKSRFPANVSLRTLPPIVTNLAAPTSTWVRLEASLVMDGEASSEGNALAAQIAEDIVVYMRTVRLAQIEGASGFQHLREDLSDRIRVRSGGKVRDLVVQSFIVE